MKLKACSPPQWRSLLPFSCCFAHVYSTFRVVITREMTKPQIQCANERTRTQTHKGALARHQFSKRRYSTGSYANTWPRVFLCRPPPLPVCTGHGHGGQLSTLLPPELPARPASCLSSILCRSGETSVTSRRDDRQLLSAAGCYCIAAVPAAQRKRGHNGLATHLAEPPLL